MIVIGCVVVAVVVVVVVRRCQVRIFGWHDDGSPESVIKIPLSDLPWALPILPLNLSRSFSVPEVDDWVVGFDMNNIGSGRLPAGAMADVVIHTVKSLSDQINYKSNVTTLTTNSIF